MKLSVMENKKPQNGKKKKIFSISTKNMGVNIDKNEYYEIKTSPTNYPEDYFRR